LEAETNKYCPGGNDIGAISNLITWVLNFFLSAYLLLCFKALRKPPVNQELPHPSICTIIALAKRDFLRGVMGVKYR
jgi:hypothetical protein